MNWFRMRNDSRQKEGGRETNASGNRDPRREEQPQNAKAASTPRSPDRWPAKLRDLRPARDAMGGKGRAERA